MREAWCFFVITINQKELLMPNQPGPPDIMPRVFLGLVAVVAVIGGLIYYFGGK